MVVAECRECDYAFAALVEREVNDAEVLQHFACPECGHEWSTTML